MSAVSCEKFQMEIMSIADFWSQRVFQIPPSFSYRRLPLRAWSNHAVNCTVAKYCTSDDSSWLTWFHAWSGVCSETHLFMQLATGRRFYFRLRQPKLPLQAKHYLELPMLIKMRARWPPLQCNFHLLAAQECSMLATQSASALCFFFCFRTRFYTCFTFELGTGCQRKTSHT